MTRSAAALLPALVLLATASAAVAQSPVPTSAVPAPTSAAPPTTAVPAPTTPPAPVPAPPPAKGTLGLTLEQVNGKSAAVLAGDRFRVRGAVRPFVAGQTVVVRFYRGSRKLATRKVAIKPTKGGTNGEFVLGYTPTGAGHITVRASHRATAALATMVAKGRGVDVLR
ncbi:MAG: hypothetical protein QOF26_955, partial [Baekduia sp.]|nr:hypothetical protein [Baekduia sp.]